MRNTTLCGGLALAAVCCLIPSAAALSPGEVLDADPYAAHQVFYDQYWEEKLTQALDYIPGVVVKVTVNVNPDLEQKVSRRQPTGTPVTVEERESEATKRTATAGKPKKNKKRDEPPVEESRRETYTRTVPFESTLKGRVAGLTPRTASAVVIVPESYLARLGGDELQRRGITSDVKLVAETLLPHYSGGPRVTVVVAARGGGDRRRSAGVAEPSSLDPGPGPATPQRGDVITVMLSDDERLAARVVTVLDNGTLVLQSRREQRVDGATVVTEFSGQVRPEQVGPDRTVTADQISEFSKQVIRARARRSRDD